MRCTQDSEAATAQQFQHSGSAHVQDQRTASNPRRIVAGLVANAFDFVITSYLMATEFDAVLARLNMDASAVQSWIPVFRRR
jgi:hypothetical protein